MQNYRKLISAIVGLVLMILYRRYGLDLTGTDDLWIDAILQSGDVIIGAATALCVWAFPNSPKTGRG